MQDKKLCLLLVIFLGCMVSLTVGGTCLDHNGYLNCRMALRFLCELAPAGTPRTQCIKNIDVYDICPKFFCFCKEGWFGDRTTGNCYRLLRGGYNWNTAKSKCASEAPNSQLTSVRNQAENDFIKSQLEWLFRVDQQLGYIGVLNGGNDLSSLNNYEWLDHTRVTFTDWQAGEPNYVGVERCIEWRRGNGWKWNNIPCSYRNRVWQALCKIEA